MFSRMTGSSVSSAAAMAGSAAFFAPLIRTVPSSGLPPRMTNLSIGEFPNLTLRTPNLWYHGATSFYEYSGQESVPTITYL